MSYIDYRGFGAPANRVFKDSNAGLSSRLLGKQTTASENHPDWAPRKRGTFEGDSGGDFTMSKTWAVSSGEHLVQQPIVTNWYNESSWQRRDRWYGPITPFVNEIGFPFPPSAQSSASGLDSLGTTAIARCSPTNQVASLATALSEFYHEGIPKMMGSSLWEKRARNARDVYKTAGDEYLKGQFGWLPLISDVTDVANVIVNSQRMLTQAQRDSGKMVRRRYYFPPIRTLTETTLASNVSPTKWGGHDVGSFYNLTNLNKGKIVRFRTTSIDRWFSGAFTYHVPNYGDGLVDQFKMADRLLGLTPDPEVLWNIAPWSWAVDWFSNVGDVIHNVNSFARYGLVLKYGYMMEHSIVSDMYSYSGPDVFISSARPQNLTLTTEVKQRRRATPFGFGLTMGGLNNTQKAIVAALGLSRVK